MNGCVFCKIRDREIPKEFVFEDNEMMVFPDLNPEKPVHILVVPKKHIEDFNDLKDKNLLFKLKATIDKVIKKEKLDNRGYRVTVNGGGSQLINHVHFHVVGPIGKPTGM